MKSAVERRGLAFGLKVRPNRGRARTHRGPETGEEAGLADGVGRNGEEARVERGAAGLGRDLLPRGDELEVGEGDDGIRLPEDGELLQAHRVLPQQLAVLGPHHEHNLCTRGPQVVPDHLRDRAGTTRRRPTEILRLRRRRTTPSGVGAPLSPTRREP